MGRKKINIEEIKDERNRQVCFGKRKLGLLKKARELSILCRCEIGIMVFAADGTLHRWNSPQSSMSDLLQRYSDATARAGAIDTVREADERLSEEYSDADDGEEAEEEPELRQSCKRKRDHRGALSQPVRPQKSASPGLRDVSVAPSALDLRLDAAAQQCSSLTPRSEKALTDISREFDNIFAQFHASEVPASAATQGSREAPGCFGLSAGVSSPVARDAPLQAHGVQQSCDPEKGGKSPVKISAWSHTPGLDARMAALSADTLCQPEPSKHSRSAAPPTTSSSFVTSTTSAFSTLPVRPIASAALPATHILDNHPALQQAHAQTQHLGQGISTPSGSNGGIIRHSSCSAFVPASAVTITGAPSLGSLGASIGGMQYMQQPGVNGHQARSVPSLPQLQLAVVPMDQPMASLPMLGAQNAALGPAPWQLTHPQALRPAMVTADQLQPLMAAQLMAKANSIPASYLAPAAYDPVKAEGFNHLFASTGAVYIPRGPTQLAPAAQANLPMRLAMGMS